MLTCSAFNCDFRCTAYRKFRGFRNFKRIVSVPGGAKVSFQKNRSKPGKPAQKPKKHCERGVRCSDETFGLGIMALGGCGSGTPAPAHALAPMGKPISPGDCYASRDEARVEVSHSSRRKCGLRQASGAPALALNAKTHRRRRQTHCARHVDPEPVPFGTRIRRIVAFAAGHARRGLIGPVQGRGFLSETFETDLEDSYTLGLEETRVRAHRLLDQNPPIWAFVVSRQAERSFVVVLNTGSPVWARTNPKLGRRLSSQAFADQSA